MYDFKDGDAVMIVQRYNGVPRSVTKATVFKAYRNGRFVLERGGQQYRDNGVPAGDAGYSSMITRVKPFDPGEYTTLRRADVARALSSIDLGAPKPRHGGMDLEAYRETVGAMVTKAVAADGIARRALAASTPDEIDAIFNEVERMKK